jgi:hypothetical protein
MGNTNGGNTYDRFYTGGGRSFSIWDQYGNLVFDSGNDFERVTAGVMPVGKFNLDEDKNTNEKRSEDGGPEPEALAIGTIGKNVYAFIGLERQGGSMVYNISNPFAPKFVQYRHNRDVTVDIATSPTNAGDLAPEGSKVIPAAESPTGKALYVTGNEISGTVTIYEVVEK